MMIPVMCCKQANSRQGHKPRANDRAMGYSIGMDAARDIRNLALTGFMGTGKSTVGRQVARELGFEFVDTDNLIEELAGVSVAKIFDQSGEAVFRKIERAQHSINALKAKIIILHNKCAKNQLANFTISISRN